MTFFTYVYTGDDHILTAERAFVCLTLFDIIRMPLAMLPLLIVYMVEVMYIELFKFEWKCMQKAKVLSFFQFISIVSKWWHGLLSVFIQI